MKKCLVIIVALLLCAVPTIAQKFLELRNDKGEVIDKVVMVDWAKVSTEKMNNYRKVATVRRHDDGSGKFRVQLLDLHLLPDHSIQYRSNVAVYFSPTYVGNFELLHTGIGFTSFGFPANQNGFYIVKAVSEKEKQVMVFGLRDHEVDLYRPLNLNARI